MAATASVIIRQQDPASIPAALVATWLAAELGAFPDATLSMRPPDTIVIDHARAEHAQLVAALARTLREPRFDGWLIRSG